ncbi:hypothetical protein Moror_8122 [Moniliophthora roreri MCA 2997]|uniref:Transmembrane protein n=1 Tax=Moniliophthora roreri (strain MCA 2997) TaxID=1381753 RepID=V2YS16_MONRO|nr:hypothetical protein Moror_8122 [Moniliophthora roreri MCA 2997]
MANPYDFSILDTSPTIIYHPSREGEDLGSSWKTFYSNSPDSSYDSTHQNTNLASGTSLHSTSMQGASFEISFMGTAIQIYGSGTGGAYTTTLDNRDAVEGNPSNGMLASYADLEYKTHTLSLNVTQSQSLNMTSARLTIGVGDKGATVKETKTDSVKVNSDGSSFLNSDYFYPTGQGTFNTFHDASNYPRVDTNNAGSTINFRASGMSAVFITGTVNYDHGLYSINLSPSAGVSSSTRTFNATSKWFAYDQLIYWESGLDRTQTYTISLTNLEEGKYVDIHEVKWLEGVPGSNNSQNDGSNGLSTPAIAGIAVGTAVIAIAVACLLFFFCWKRRRNQGDYDGPTPATYSGQVHAMQKLSAHSQPLLEAYIEPFVLPPNTPYSDHTTSTGQHSKFQSLSSYTSSSHTPHPSDIPTFQPHAGYGYPYSTPWAPTASSTQLSASASASASGSGSNSGARPPSSSGKGGPEPPPRAVRQELDAGPVPIHDFPHEEVLPPGYNPAWSSGPS